MGSVVFQSSLDYRFLSRPILGGIHDLHNSSGAVPERGLDIQRFLKHTVDMIITAEAFSAGAGLLKK